MNYVKFAGLILLIISETAFSFDTLSESKEKKWQNLLFYENNKSLVTEKNFFIASNGQKSAFEELKETVFLLQSASGKAYKKDEKRPFEILEFSCRFPARFQYLAPRLNINYEAFKCNDFETWKDSFEATGLSLIFASQYLENPASSFGHTFLKINSLKKTLYLNKIISFAATVPENVSAPSYIWNGLTGGFDGFFSVYPFYLTFQEYANMERRDLWEYKLNIGQEQTDRVLAHLYELIHGAKLDYTFMSKNCSGFLLRVLETEFNQDLLVDLSFYVMPIESVKALIKRDLISQVIFHPSITSRLKRQGENLNSSELSKFTHFINGNENLTNQDSSQILDMGIEYMNFIRQKSGGVFSSNDKNKFSQLLSARASKAEDANDNSTPRSEILIYPELASNPMRFSLGYLDLGNKKMSTLSFKPVGKDFFDRPNGYLKESEINVLKTTLFFNLDHSNDYQFSIDLIGLRKYVDYDVITKNTSWGINLSIQSDLLSSCPDCYFGELDSYYGLGKNIFDQTTLVYSSFHPLIRYGNLKDSFFLIPKLEVGSIYSDLNYIFKIALFYGLKINDQESDNFTNASVLLTKILNQKFSVHGVYNYEGIYAQNIFEFKLSYSF